MVDINRAIPRPQLIGASATLMGNALAGGNTLIEMRASTKNGGYVATNLRLLLPGFFVDGTGSGNGDQVMGNLITWKGAIEKVSPNFANVACFQGQPTYSANIDSNGTANATGGLQLSDPLGVYLAAGETFYVQTEQRVADTSKSTLNGTRPPVKINGLKSTSLATGQVGLAGTWSATGRTTTSSTPPLCAVVGTPSQNYPSVAIFGDSILSGSNDSTGDGNGNYGFVQRGLYAAGAGGNPVPSINLSCPGEKVSQVVAGSATLRFGALKYVSHVITNYATNDIVAAQSYNTVSANLTTWWAMLRAYGVKVIQVKILPRTNSSDSFQTPGNQTAQTGFGAGGVRDQINAFISAQLVAGAIDGVIDPNVIFEDQSNPGKWVTNGTVNYATSDGTHPSSAVTALALSVVSTPASAFVYSPTLAVL